MWPAVIKALTAPTTSLLPASPTLKVQTQGFRGVRFVNNRMPAATCKRYNKGSHTCSCLGDRWRANRLSTLLVGTLSSLLASTAYAQSLENSPPAKSDTPVLQELEITGGLQSAPPTGDVVESEHTGSRVRIERQRLEQPGAQLGKLISTSSGVQERQIGGFGSFSAVTIRAASAAQTAVFLDGILLNSGGRGVIDLSTLEMLNLSSVDIYKGTSPLQLGHAAIGGAVNLSTLKASSENGAKIKLGIGSFSQFTAASSFHGSSNKWNWTGSATHLQSENDFTFLDRNEPLVSDDDAEARRRNNDVQRNSVLLKAGYEHAQNQNTSILFQLTNRDIGVPDQQNTRANRATFESLDGQLQISHRLEEWKGWNNRHTLYWHESDTLFDDSDSTIGLGRQIVDSDTRTLGVKAYWERFIETQTLGFSTLGLSVDIRDESIEQFDKLEANSSDFISDRVTVLSTAHLALANDSETWLVTPAVRWQTSERSGTTVSRNLGTEPTDQNVSEGSVQLGAQYTLSPAINLSANAGNYFRQPSFGELFSASGLINGNPSLEPETGINLDAGIGYKSNKVSFDARIFRSLRDDLILLSVDARGVGRPENIGKSIVDGLEFSANWQATDYWSLQGNATFQDPRNRSSFESVRNKLLPGQAKRAFFTRLKYQPTNIAYWYEWQSTNDRFFDTNNDLEAPDTSIHAIGADLKKSQWQLNVSIQNLTDDTIEDFNGFPKPGRSFHLAFSIDL